MMLMIRRRIESFLRRIRERIDDNDYVHVEVDDEDDDEYEDYRAIQEDRATSWIPEGWRNMTRIYHQFRQERLLRMRQQQRVNERRNRDAIYLEDNNRRYPFLMHSYSLSRRQWYHSRRREQQIVWQNVQQIDAILMNLVETISEINLYYIVFSCLFMFIILQARNFFFDQRKWRELCDFFINSNFSDDHFSIERFTQQFGCFTIIGCVNIITNYGALLNLRHKSKNEKFDISSQQESINPKEIYLNLDLFEQKYYNSKLLTLASQKKESLIVKHIFDKESIPLKSQKHLIKLFNIESINKLEILSRRLQDTYNRQDEIIFQSLSSLEKQMMNDILYSYKRFMSKYCSDTSILNEQFDCLKKQIWIQILLDDSSYKWNMAQIAICIMISIALGTILRYSEDLFEWFESIVNFFRGNGVSSSRSVLDFPSEVPSHVENTLMFRIFFFKRNNDPYEVMPDDDVIIDVSNQQRIVQTTIERTSNQNEWQVWFPARIAGEYLIRVIVDGKHVQNSPYHLLLSAGSPSPSNIRILNYSSSIVSSPQRETNLLEIELRDKYGNPCNENTDFDAFLKDFSFYVCDIATREKVIPRFLWVSNNEKPSNFCLYWSLPNFGMFQAEVFYQDKQIISGRFQILNVPQDELITLEEYASKCLNKKIHNFEAKLLPTHYRRTNSGSSAIYKSKSVTCFLSSKQIIIQDYFLKIIPRRVATIRVCPSTKLYFARDYLEDSSNNISASTSSTSFTSSSNDSLKYNEPSQRCPDKNQFIIIDDGSQNPFELLIPDRNIFVRTFSKILLNNIGGSETFQDKETYFYQELAKINHEKFRNDSFASKKFLSIDRKNILESTMSYTKNFNENMWKSNFEIEFIGEEGIDYGGLRKEWFDLICKELFEPKKCEAKSLFCCFTNTKQGFVHPNSRCTLPLSYYEFAGKIVGKSLIDTALGSRSIQCLVNARFTRSFLVQLIGLDVNYHHFETDDPELFITKVKFLLDNNIEDLELYFTDDEYNSDRKLIKTHDLIARGSKTRVTDQNKRDYLTRLAHHRLSLRVHDKIQAFLKGLNFLIPDQLLSIFDANELELLICGAETYSLSDLRLHHEFTGSTNADHRILSWFWKSLSKFSDEEMARLLQFTTGSSRLPARGFSDLMPRFNITISPDYCFGKLPIAHTCFNQICLPDHETFEDFDRSLKTAITEGNQGFGFS